MKNRIFNSFTTIFLFFFSTAIYAQVPKTGQVLWLKADAGIGLDAKGNVKTWADQSGKKCNAVQNTLTLRPKYIKKGPNGMPTLRFDGVDDNMTCPSKFPINRNFTIISVVRINNIYNYNTIVGGSSSMLFWGAYSYTPALWYNYITAVSSKDSIKNNYTAMSAMVDTGAKKAYFYTNDSLSSTNRDTMANTDNGINIGSFNAAYYFLDGDISEVLIYNRTLSQTERDSIQIYLNSKYALTGQNGNISMSKVPQYFQFYPRDKSDSGTVKFRGEAIAAGYDTAKLLVYRNDTLIKSYQKTLNYAGTKAPLNFDARIHAELSEYSFEMHLTNSTKDTMVFFQSDITCGDVYVVAGQSNSIASSYLTNYSNEFVRSYGSNTEAADGDAGDTSWGRGNGVYGSIFATGSWGIVLAQRLKEEHHMPICVLNGGVGGTPVAYHLRDNSDPENLKTAYGRLLYRMRHAGLDSGLKAIMWYQGESNTIYGYSQDFHLLYNSWTKDYPNVQHFYIVQIHTGCGGGSDVREELRTLPDTLKNTSPMSTAALPSHDGCHYYAGGVVDGYDSLGLHFFRVLDKQFYGSKDTLNIAPPDVQKVFYTDSTYREIGILFREKNAGITWTKDDTATDVNNKPFIFNIRHAFYLDQSFGHVTKVSTSGDTLKLSLDTNSRFSRIRYIPGTYYENTYTIYEGPWLINKRKIGALTFDNFPIDTFIPRTHAALAFNTDSICIGSTTMFTNTSTLKYGNFTSWYWDFGDGSNSATMSPTHKYKAPGVYNVTLYSSNSTGVNDSLTLPVRIDSLPRAGFTKSTINGFTYNFAPIDSNLASYSWNFGDGSFSNHEFKKYTYSDFGKFYITLTVMNSDNCSNTSMDSVNIVITGINKDEDKNIRFIVSPNPFTESTVISYSIDKNSSISILLMDDNGRIVNRLFDGIQIAGQHSLMIDADKLKLSKGIYQLVFISGDGQTVRKIVKL